MEVGIIPLKERRKITPKDCEKSINNINKRRTEIEKEQEELRAKLSGLEQEDKTLFEVAKRYHEIWKDLDYEGYPYSKL